MTAELFSDDPAIEGLASRSVRSGATAIGSRAAQLFLQLGAVMVLARILTPADFGIQAMVIPLSFLVNGISNQGLQSAVMHERRLGPADVNGLFYYALPINALLTSAMALLGPVLAWIYGEPRVILVTAAWAGVLFLVTLSAIHEALLKRQLRFATVARAQLSSHALSFAAAIVAALAGAGYWALMVQVAVMELVRAGCMWLLVSWRPQRVRARGENERSLRSYWLGLMGARTISWFGDQSDRVAVGALGGAAVAGLYDSAKRWAWFSFFELFVPLTDVAVATLSRVRHQTEVFREYVREALLSVVSLTFPVAAFMFVQAQLVLHVLLGPQWLGAAVFVRWLCVALIGATVIRLMQWVYLATGTTMRQLRWSLVTTPALLIAVVSGGLIAGPVGVAAGLALATLLLAVPSALNAIRGTPLTLMDCIGVLMRPLIASAFAAAALGLLDRWLPATAPLIALIVRLPIFLALYMVGWVLLPGGLLTLKRQRPRLQAMLATWRGARLRAKPNEMPRL